MPIDIVATDELKTDLLNRFNTNWQDWTFRDIISVDNCYSEEQKRYFETMPGKRGPIIEQIKQNSTFEK